MYILLQWCQGAKENVFIHNLMTHQGYLLCHVCMSLCTIVFNYLLQICTPVNFPLPILKVSQLPGTVLQVPSSKFGRRPSTLSISVSAQVIYQ